MKFQTLILLLILVENLILAQSSKQPDNFNIHYKHFGIPGKMGLRLVNGNIIVPENTYDDIGPFYCYRARVYKNNNFGFIDTTGKLVIPLIYRDVWDFEENFARFKENGKFGFINIEGKVVIEPTFDIAFGFSEGFAPINFGGRETTSDGELPVISRIDGLWGMIDKKGQIVIPIKFTFLYGFSEGLAIAVSQDSLFGAIDTLGNWVINPIYEKLDSFRDGLCGVRIKGKYGFLNRKGQIVIKPQFDDIREFSNGKCAVKFDNGSWVYIDKTGRFIDEK
jgi:WG containing repeat